MRGHLEDLREAMFETYQRRCRSVAAKIHAAAHAITDEEEIRAISANLDRVLEVCDLARQSEFAKAPRGIVRETEHRMNWDKLLAVFFGRPDDPARSGGKRLMITS